MDEHERIDRLEYNVNRLIKDYQQFFQGIVANEPARRRESVEVEIRKLRNTYITNTSARFKFDNVVAKFNSYRQLWNRKLQKLEAEGLSPKAREELRKEKSTDGQETL